MTGNGMKRRIGYTIALWAALGATTAQAATPCLSEPEAEALMITLLPDVINAAGTACAASLPPQATLRGGLPALIGRYRAEAPTVWPQARTALGKVMGEEMKGVDPELMRPLIGAMMAPMLAKEIKPADCPKVDRVVSLLSPLPARNTAGILVLLFTLGTQGKRDKAPFTICPVVPQP
jgi:hypothetical protein